MKARLILASLMLLGLFLFSSPFLFPSGISNGGGLSGITLNALVIGQGASPVIASPVCTIVGGGTLDCSGGNIKTSNGAITSGTGNQIRWNASSIMQDKSNGVIQLTDNGGGNGVSLDFTTDTVLNLANRANTASATLGFPTANAGGLRFKTGSNGRVGTGTLAGGTLAVANTSVTANTFIFVQDTGGGVIANIGALYVASQTAGVGFTVTSSNAIDTSTFKYWLFETN